MSLLIVGSCSRVTQHLILRLAREARHSSITVLDPLPLYHHHERYYALRRRLLDQKTALPVHLQKLISVPFLAQNISSHDEVLYVTHDYFQNVIAKTKLMQLTAQLNKNKRTVFATPIEYDHYGYNNPEEHYKQSEQEVKKANSHSDLAETYAYLRSPKNFFQEHLISVPESFRPKVASSEVFASQVNAALSGEEKESVCVRGEKQASWKEVEWDREVAKHETAHHVDNIRQLVSRYKGPEDKHSKVIIG